VCGDVTQGKVREYNKDVKCICWGIKEIEGIRMKGMRLAKLAGIILIFIILTQGAFSKQIKDVNKDDDIDAKNKILASSGYSGSGIKLIANIGEPQKVEIQFLPEPNKVYL
jgi:hypothetical protein